MGKLNQIIAVEKGIKGRVHSVISELYKVVQKPDLFNGFAKTYEKKDEDGEELPREHKRVQYTAPGVLDQIAASMTELFDVTARKDWTNNIAVADVRLDDHPLLYNVPVTFLLFLEKQVQDIRTFMAAMPVLDEAESWVHDTHSGLHKTDAIKTHRTKKINKPIVMYHATVEHPAQTAMVTEDTLAGFWSSVKHSGAIPKPEKAEMVRRADLLLQAIKKAREEANGVDEIVAPNVGNAIFTYLLGR